MPTPERPDPLRLAIVSGHPTQWEAPLFARLARDRRIDLHVIYGSDEGVSGMPDPEIGLVFDWSEDLTQGYAHTFLKPAPDGIRQLVSHLRDGRVDAVIVEGHDRWPVRVAILVAKLSGIPLLHRLDSRLGDDRPFKKRLKEWLLPPFLRQIQSFLPLSSSAIRYLESFDVERERIFLAPYTVDNEWYAERCESWRAQRDQVRAELGISTAATVAVAVLRFVERERPLDFVKAAHELQKAQRHDVVFVLVGDGPQRGAVDSLIAEAQLTSVVLPGFRPLSDLPRFYAIADMFVHPGVGEAWGLSVNEAMACGLPVVLSDRVGAGEDLLIDGGNGLRYEAGNCGELAQRIARLADDEQLRLAMGEAARTRIAAWNYDRSIESIVDAVEFAIRDSCGRAVAAR